MNEQVYTRQDIGVRITQADLVAIADSNPNGAFIYLRGYRKGDTTSSGASKQGKGEVANYLLRLTRYDNLVAASKKMLNDWMMGLIPDVNEFEATWNYWLAPDGSRHVKNKKNSNRQFVSDTATYHFDDDVVQNAMQRVMQGLTAPDQTRVPDWHDIAKGLGGLDSTGKLYLRNVTCILKTTTTEGVYTVSCSYELENVLVEAIRSKLPVGAIRCFTLTPSNDGDEFVSLSIGGKTILADDQGVLETLPEFVKYIDEQEQAQAE